MLISFIEIGENMDVHTTVRVRKVLEVVNDALMEERTLRELLIVLILDNDRKRTRCNRMDER
jgi:hypothetical protein